MKAKPSPVALLKPKRNEDLVRHLREWLAHAERGELRAAVVVAEFSDGHIGRSFCFLNRGWALLGAVTDAQHDLIHSLNQR